MQGYTKVTYLYHPIFRVLTLSMLIFLIAACGQQVSSNAQNSTSSFKHYNRDGLDVILPEGWLFSYDSGGIISDRRVDFETADLSAVSIYFCDASPCNNLKVSNRIIKLNSLETNEDVRDFQSEKVKIYGYDGLQLNWTERGFVGEEIKTEVTILELRSKPYPVLVRFHFFDGEIIDQQTNILPFLEGISFDPQGVKL